jgi:hypothetical protein
LDRFPTKLAGTQRIGIVGFGDEITNRVLYLNTLARYSLRALFTLHPGFALWALLTLDPGLALRAWLSRLTGLTHLTCLALLPSITCSRNELHAGVVFDRGGRIRE